MKAKQLMNLFISLSLFLLGLPLGASLYHIGLRLAAGKVGSRSPISTSGRFRLNLRNLRRTILSFRRKSEAGSCQGSCKGSCQKSGGAQAGLYVVTAVVTGSLWMGVYLKFGWSGRTLVGLTLAGLGVLVSVTDFKSKIIPNKVLLFFAPLLFIMVLVFPSAPLWSHLVSGIISGAVLVLIALLSGGGIGMGDAKLFALCGFVLGLPLAFLALLLACIFAIGVYSVAGFVRTTKGPLSIPFGPGLVLGTLAAYTFDSQLLSAYFSLF